MKYEYDGPQESATVTRRFDAMPERLLDAWIEPVKIEAAAFSTVAEAQAMTLDEFFAGHDVSKRIFGTLDEMIVALGPAEMCVTKSQVAFRRRRTFAWAWMPGMYRRGKPSAVGLDPRAAAPTPVTAMESDRRADAGPLHASHGVALRCRHR